MPRLSKRSPGNLETPTPMYFPMLFNVPMHLTFNGLTVFWPVEPFSRFRCSPSSFTWNNEFWSRLSICRFREGGISSLHWYEVPLTFRKPKHHFIVGKEESHKSIKLSLHFWVPGNCTYDGFTEKDGGKGVFDKGTPSQVMVHLGSVTPSFFVLSVTQVQVFIPAPTPSGPMPHTRCKISLSLYVNLGRKPHAGFWRAEKASGWNVVPIIHSQIHSDDSSRENSKYHQRPFELNFAFPSCLKISIGCTSEKA